MKEQIEQMTAALRMWGRFAADTYTTLLHSYEYLSAQMGPLYRALRDMEQKRDRWRTLTIVLVLAIAGQLIARWVLPR